MASSGTKRAWKLQEFVAHGSSVNCLALGHKSGRVMVTGGEDRKVNMWAVGKPNCIMSLSGHTSPVESVRFNNSEEMVVAGSLSGALKIWDLEQAKIVRTLTGHKSCIKGLDFHPYGDFVASGSLDTNIKLWDIRRKGCIFTYKGHTGCVNSLRFSPDGRWIASAGEDSTFKLWDLTAGKLLHDFKQHSGPVSTIEFHPNEFLIASASMDRTIKFWDLETFHPVCSTDGDSLPIRCIFFHPEGQCVYSGTQDMLKVYGWEPSRCFDSLAMAWGKVADISIAQNQLIGATFSQTNVSTFVVDVQRVQPLGGPPAQVVSPPPTARFSPTAKKSPPKNIPPARKLSCGRRSFSSRPPTQSTKRTEMAKMESEDPPAAEDPDDSAVIQDPSDYKEIFQPSRDLGKHSVDKIFQPSNNLAHSPPKKVEPFPAPPDDGPPAATPAPTIVIAPKPAAPKAAPTVPKATPVIPPPSESAATPRAAPPSSAAASRAPSSNANVTPAEPRPVRTEKTQPQRPHTGTRVVPASRDKPAGINVNEFLPRQMTPSISQEGTQPDMSEGEALSSIMKGCDSMAAVMSSRHKNLQIVRALWTGGNTKTAIDSAISMNDRAIIVDLLNILVQKPGLWNLDICTLMLPQLSDLISSKYENYVETGCASLKVVLRNFASVIKANMTAPPSVGVDISREERYNKCKSCYKYLMDIRNDMSQKTHQHGKNAPMLKELQLLMSQLD